MISCTFEDGGKGNLRHVVIDAIIIKDNKILMVKRSEKLVQGGKWGIIGGFVERNENIEQGLRREVLEETGYTLNKIDFFTIIDRPDRINEDRQNIAFVFVCNAGEKTGQADSESTKQQWFELDKLPQRGEIAFDHYEIINLYLKNKDFIPVNHLKYY